MGRKKEAQVNLTYDGLREMVSKMDEAIVRLPCFNCTLILIDSTGSSYFDLDLFILSDEENVTRTF